MSHPGLEPVSMPNANTTGKGLTYSAKVQAPIKSFFFFGSLPIAVQSGLLIAIHSGLSVSHGTWFKFLVIFCYQGLQHSTGNTNGKLLLAVWHQRAHIAICCFCKDQPCHCSASNVDISPFWLFCLPFTQKFPISWFMHWGLSALC